MIETEKCVAFLGPENARHFLGKTSQTQFGAAFFKLTREGFFLKVTHLAWL